MRHASLLAVAALLLAMPAAADVSLVPPAQAAAQSSQLGAGEGERYRLIFQALRAGDYSQASAILDMVSDGPLKAVARAELLLANPAGRDPSKVAELLAAAPELPEAPALAKMSPVGAALPIQHALVRAGGPSKRAPSRPARDCAMLAAQVQPLLRTGDAAAAEILVEAASGSIAPEALTEWRYKVAWAYFQGDDDVSARRLGMLAQTGAGDWAVDAAWVSGLAAWRMRDFRGAADTFARVASNAGDDETKAAGLFWAARSDLAAGNEAGANPRLLVASRLGETFYGMLASAALGLPLEPPGFLADETADTLKRPNLLRAAALIEIGEAALADQFIRYEARIGEPAQHPALIAFAAKLGLPATQVWLARNMPAGTRTSLAARFPRPGWSPVQGWRVDPALIYAHALQESEFRNEAVSPSGARGLMQIMPATAQMIARHKGDIVRSLNDPSVSFEYGQSYLEELAINAGTAGLLPKVIAAYNAGPNNVARWTAGGDDPLLFIESIPFAQTRAYVAIVLRNYWIYQREAGTAVPSLTAMAQGRWPRFPTHADRTAQAAGASYAPN
ncbi:MAG TPA: lytic transglycosylase domain-containing protein [Sphingomonas sp.]|nr:lytic transglycosylase domain-containing protein [Sphingomonas sp.]